MLDLMRWKRVSETSDLIGCKAVGGKVPLFYRDESRDGKKHFGGVRGLGTGGTGTVGLTVDF